MARLLRAAAMGLTELLVRYEQFLVPEFQRVYGWGEVEIGRLLSDLSRAMLTEGKRYFLGTFYLAAPDDSADCALIADGQQRLVTAMIAYAVARDLTTDAAQADKLHAVVASREEGKYRLVPRDRDAAFFKAWVQERTATLKPFAPADPALAAQPADASPIEDPEVGLSESQRNIIANRDAIAQHLHAIGEAGMMRLLKYLEDETDLVVITAASLEEARNAYASTQTRGLRQAETDKLKAELIADCPVALRARLAGQWEECEAMLGREDLAELLQHMIVVCNERKAQHAIEVDLFKAFDLPNSVEAFIGGELVPSARAYRWLAGASLGSNRIMRRIAGHLVTLQRTTHTAWKAPALLALRQYESEPAILEAILRDLERLAAALMIRGTDPNLMIERYVGVIREMKARAKGALPSLALTDAEKADARRGLADSRFAIRDRYRMPMLLKINDLLAGEAQAVDPKTVSCEHILPRNVPASSPWRQAFRSSDGRRFEGGRYVHMLGNLAVLPHIENRMADTHPYAEKRSILKRSSFDISKDAAKSKAWTPDVVLARSDRLAKLLIEHWRL